MVPPTEAKIAWLIVQGHHLGTLAQTELLVQSYGDRIKHVQTQQRTLGGYVGL